jgi:hypothetical protein
MLRWNELHTLQVFGKVDEAHGRFVLLIYSDVIFELSRIFLQFLINKGVSLDDARCFDEFSCLRKLPEICFSI